MRGNSEAEQFIQAARESRWSAPSQGTPAPRRPAPASR